MAKQRWVYDHMKTLKLTFLQPMLLQISLPILVLMLAACGGSSSDSENTLSATQGDDLAINSIYTGAIGFESKIDFNYTPTEDTLVALLLTGTAEDLDISVSSTELTKFSLGDNSNEGIVFNAVANQEYVISIVSWLEGGSYQLTLVEGNRASLGLEENEHYVELILTASETCNGEISESEGYVDSIFNFAQGYVTDINDFEKVEFDSVNGNTLIKDTSYNEEEEQGEGEIQFTLSPDDGVVTGSNVGSYSYSFSGETVNCSYNNTFTGGILL